MIQLKVLINHTVCNNGYYTGNEQVVTAKFEGNILINSTSQLKDTGKLAFWRLMPSLIVFYQDLLKQNYDILKIFPFRIFDMTAMHPFLPLPMGLPKRL